MTREQIEAILAGCEGVTPGPWTATTCSDIWVEHDQKITEDDEGFTGVALCGDVSWPNSNLRQKEWESVGMHIARCDPDTMRELCRLALLGLDAEAVATASVALAEVFDAGTVDAPSYAKGFIAGQEAMRERATDLARETIVQVTRSHGVKVGFFATELSIAIRALPIEGEK